MRKAITARKSRREKIELVKGLLSGKASLSDHRKHRVFMWEHLDEFYSLEDGSLKLTESEFNAYCRDLGHSAHHIILEDFRTDLKPATA